MGSPSELSLDFKPNSFSTLLKSFGDQTDQTQKMEEFLARLEEERLKIDAFKRELPLCMQLLNNAMEAYRQQLENCQTVQGSRPILEEFIPLKIQRCDESDQKPADPSEKANWMTSVPLWSQASSEGSKHQAPTNTPPKGLDNGLGDGPKLALDNKQRNGGAFLPFSKERNMCANSNIPALPDLALASVDKENENKRCLESGNGLMPAPRREICNKSAGGTTEHGRGTTLNNAEGQTTTTASTTQTQAQRKARRCWSPDLHRRFVNALQMLGGSQVATPKQIRELMKVDGLTNDEVKSHLQKYRLHTRRPGPTPPAPATPGPHLVFLGGILVPPEFAAATHGAAPAIYGAHLASHASTPYCPPTVQQEFYPPAPAPPPHHPLHHHHYNAYNRASSQARSSPETDARVAGERSESIEEEEGKSESGSWKGGGAEGEKGLLPLRDEGAEEDSNGSDITLKF